MKLNRCLHGLREALGMDSVKITLLCRRVIYSYNSVSECDRCVNEVYSGKMCVCVWVWVAHIVSSWFFLSGSLDGISQEAEDGANPQQDGESTKQLATELDPLWGCGRRGEGIGAIPDQKLCCLGIGQALKERQRERDVYLAEKGQSELM